MKKRIFTVMLALIMCLALTSPVIAAPPLDDVSKGSVSDLTEAEIRLVESIFETSSDVKLVDSNGNNVKGEFIEKYQSLYNSGNYKKIIDDIADNSLTLLELKRPVDSIEGQNVVPRRIALKRTARATKTIKLINDSGGFSTHNLILTLEADYSVIDYNNTINGAESLIRIVSQQNVPSNWESKILGRSGEAAVVSSDRKSIKFSTNFYIQTCHAGGVPVGGLTQKAYVSFFGYV